MHLEEVTLDIFVRASKGTNDNSTNANWRNPTSLFVFLYLIVMKEFQHSRSYKKLVTQNPKGTYGYPGGIQMPLGMGDIQLLENVNLKIVEGDNEVQILLDQVASE